MGQIRERVGGCNMEIAELGAETAFDVRLTQLAHVRLSLAVPEAARR